MPELLLGVLYRENTHLYIVAETCDSLQKHRLYNVYF